MSRPINARAAEDAVDVSDNSKLAGMEEVMVDVNAEGSMTTDAGAPVYGTDKKLHSRFDEVELSLYPMREIQSLVHERIPERVIYAKGAGAFGTFRLFESIGSKTSAKVLNDTSRVTPVFVRFSNLGGGQGSPDTLRDVRGFAVKFYTEEGNWDLLCQSLPVAAVKDGSDFADFVHAMKPEPHSGLPYGRSGHSNLWDFVNHHPDSLHMMLRLMSPAGLPRSYRMMRGFSVNTFTFVNDKGECNYVRFRWIPHQGPHSLSPEEAILLAGSDPSYYHRDLMEAINNECYPSWDLAIQTISEDDITKLHFDPFDSTLMWPEKFAATWPIGTLELNHNLDEQFPESEQAAFSPLNLVPGIELSPDPLLKYRTFAYAEAHSTRLGINAHELPINAPRCPVFNNGRDGPMRRRVTKGSVNYWPNRFYACPPDPEPPAFAPRITRTKPEWTNEGVPLDQAREFLDCLRSEERKHIERALVFDLSNCDDPTVPDVLLNKHLAAVDLEMASNVARFLGVELIASPGWVHHAPKYNPDSSQLQISDEVTRTDSFKVAVLLADDFNYHDYTNTVTQLRNAKCFVHPIGLSLAKVVPEHPGDDDANEMAVKPTSCIVNQRSVQFDALLIPGGDHIHQLRREIVVHDWIQQTFRHNKPIAVTRNAGDLIKEALNLTPGLKLSNAETPVVDWYGIVSTSTDVPSGPSNPLSRETDPTFTQLFLRHISRRCVRARERKFPVS